jgi:hypothetical protein
MPSADVAADVEVSWLTTAKTDPFHAMDVQYAADGSVLVVHVTPSGEVAAIVDACAMAQNTVPFHAMDFHVRAAGNVLAVHVIPSEDVAAAVDPPAHTTQNTAPFHAIADIPTIAAGMARNVHVIPSGDVAHCAVLLSIATYATPFHATATQLPDGIVRAAHVTPSADVAATVLTPLFDTATN